MSRLPISPSKVSLPLVFTAAILCIPTCASAADKSIPYPGDLGQAIAALLIFAGLLFVLGKWAWKPILSLLHQREESISRSLDESTRREQEAKDLKGLYQARLGAVEEEAGDIIAQARKEADAAGRQIINAARIEAKKKLSCAQREIDEAKAEARRELSQMTAKLAVDIAERVVARNLDANERSRLIEDSMEEIRKNMTDAQNE